MQKVNRGMQGGEKCSLLSSKYMWLAQSTRKDRRTRPTKLETGHSFIANRVFYVDVVRDRWLRLFLKRVLLWCAQLLLSFQVSKKV